MGTFIIRPTLLTLGGLPLTDGNNVIPSNYEGWIINFPFTIIQQVSNANTTPSPDPQGLLQAAVFTDAQPSGSFDDVLRFSFFGLSFYLDGSPTPISFAGLPAGFIVQSATVKYPLTESNPDPPNPGFANFYLQFDQFTEGPANATTFTYPTTINILDLYSNGCGIRVSISVSDFDDGNSIQLGNIFDGTNFDYDVLRIEGTYTIGASQFTIQNADVPVHVGDKVVITSDTGGLDGIKQVKLNYTDPILGPSEIDIDIPSWFIIIQEFNLFEFYIPYGLGAFIGPLLITLVGNGVQFSGSVVLGTINILFADASGIYTLAVGQTNDVLYFREGYNTVNELIFLDEILEDDDSENLVAKANENGDFYSLLNYPQAILAQTEEDELDNFTSIGILQVVTVPMSVEIPSPFAETAFLP